MAAIRENSKIMIKSNPFIIYNYYNVPNQIICKYYNIFRKWLYTVYNALKKSEVNNFRLFIYTKVLLERKPPHNFNKMRAIKHSVVKGKINESI